MLRATPRSTSNDIHYPFTTLVRSSGLLSVSLRGSCSKEDDGPEDVSGAEITATFQFGNGKKVNYAFTHEKDDIILPSVNGPNGNNHYKLWLRGERDIEGSIYTINIYEIGRASCRKRVCQYV